MSKPLEIRRKNLILAAKNKKRGDVRKLRGWRVGLVVGDGCSDDGGMMDARDLRKMHRNRRTDFAEHKQVKAAARAIRLEEHGRRDKRIEGGDLSILSRAKQIKIVSIKRMLKDDKNRDVFWFLKVYLEYVKTWDDEYFHDLVNDRVATSLSLVDLTRARAYLSKFFGLDGIKLPDMMIIFEEALKRSKSLGGPLWGYLHQMFGGKPLLVMFLSMIANGVRLIKSSDGVIKAPKFSDADLIKVVDRVYPRNAYANWVQSRIARSDACVAPKINKSVDLSHYLPVPQAIRNSLAKKYGFHSRDLRDDFYEGLRVDLSEGMFSKGIDVPVVETLKLSYEDSLEKTIILHLSRCGFRPKHIDVLRCGDVESNPGPVSGLFWLAQELAICVRNSVVEKHCTNHQILRFLDNTQDFLTRADRAYVDATEKFLACDGKNDCWPIFLCDLAFLPIRSMSLAVSTMANVAIVGSEVGISAVKHCCASASCANEYLLESLAPQSHFGHAVLVGGVNTISAVRGFFASPESRLIDITQGFAGDCYLQRVDQPGLLSLQQSAVNWAHYPHSRVANACYCWWHSIRRDGIVCYRYSVVFYEPDVDGSKNWNAEKNAYELFDVRGTGARERKVTMPGYLVNASVRHVYLDSHFIETDAKGREVESRYVVCPALVDNFVNQFRGFSYVDNCKRVMGAANRNQEANIGSEAWRVRRDSELLVMALAKCAECREFTDSGEGKGLA